MNFFTTVDLRATHPNLFRMVLLLGVLFVGLGLNFFLLVPTFPVYGAPYELWATIFVALGSAKLLLLGFYKKLRVLRLVMATCIAFTLFFGVGTMQPWFMGEGSLQLPMLYLAVALIELPLLIEPYKNPVTERNGKP